MGVELVQPVMSRRALFCCICREFRCVGAKLLDQAGEAYDSVGLMYCLYIVCSVSLWHPKSVAARAFSVLVFMLAVLHVLSVCFLKERLGSKVRPSTFGCFCSGRGVL